MLRAISRRTDRSNWHRYYNVYKVRSRKNLSASRVKVQQWYSLSYAYCRRNRLVDLHVCNTVMGGSLNRTEQVLPQLYLEATKLHTNSHSAVVGHPLFLSPKAESELWQMKNPVPAQQWHWGKQRKHFTKHNSLCFSNCFTHSSTVFGHNRTITASNQRFAGVLC